MGCAVDAKHSWLQQLYNAPFRHRQGQQCLEHYGKKKRNVVVDKSAMYANMMIAGLVGSVLGH